MPNPPNGLQDSTTGRLTPQKGTDGAAHVNVSAGFGSWSNYPETWYEASTATAGDGSDNTAFGAIDVTTYEGVIFDTTAGEVTVQMSIDGANYQAVDVYFKDLGAIDATAEELAYVNTTTSNVGPYFIRTPCSKIQFLNDGAVQATVRFARVGKAGGF